MTDSNSVHPVDEKLPLGRLGTLGLQHVLVMYGGAVAVPLIVGRALQLSPEDVAYLISADLFVCGIVTIIQSFGLTRHCGIKLPVMMGVTFASVGPMVSMANMTPGIEGARLIFGSIIGAGIIAFLLAPLMGRLLRFFPPVVTGTMRGTGCMLSSAIAAELTEGRDLISAIDRAKRLVLGAIAAAQ